MKIDIENLEPDEINGALGHFISGELITRGECRPLLRPSDSKEYAEIPYADEETIDHAVQSAHESFRHSGWASMAPRSRAAILRRWADLIDTNSSSLALLEAIGSTRPVMDVSNRDIPASADCIRFFAEYADKLGGDVAATKSDNFGFTATQPYGVVAAIAPWNYPLQMACWKVGPALAAGNAVVLKPSEFTPLTAIRLAQLALEAGVPAGIFNVVNGDGTSAGAPLVKHQNVAKVTFTGSTHTGVQIIGATAVNGLRPVTLELGGKSPQIVFADAPDLDQAARCVANGIFNNAGQVCVAGSRLLVQRAVADEFLERLVALSAIRRPKRTWDRNCNLSPIINETQLRRIERIVENAKTDGALVLTGGQRLDELEGGHYYAPTILTGVHDYSRVVAEEIFGPVLTVQIFDEEEEAFASANSGSYGLNAGVFTADLGRTMRAVRMLDVGTVWINHYSRTTDFNLAVGGFKSSGIGKDLGREAVEQNLRRKSVLIEFATR